MIDIILLTIKNFKLVLRSKAYIVSMILIPILIIFLLGLAFNHSDTYSINVGIHTTKYSELTNEIVDGLKESNFKIIIENNLEQCVSDVKISKTNLCMIFPPDMKIEQGKTQNIDFHVDPSKTNLVWAILDTVSQKLSTKSEEISLELTSTLINKLEKTKDEIDSRTNALNLLESTTNELLDDKVDTTELKSLSQSTKDGVNELIILVNEKLIDIKKTVEALPDSSEKESILDDRSDVIELINDIKANSTESNDQLLSKLNAVSSKIDSMSSKLSSNKNSIESIQNAFSNIKGNLNSLDSANAEGIVNPITSTIKPIVQDKTHLNYIFAGLIVLIIMFVGILMASTIVMSEKKSKSYLINYMSPTKDISFVISSYLTIMIVMVIQLMILLGVATYFYKSSILSNLLNISTVLLVATSVFVLLGMLIAHIFKTEQEVNLITVATATIFLLISDLILPLESMPRYFQAIVKFNPFLIAENLLKGSILFNSSFSTLFTGLLQLVIYSIVLFILILLNEKLLKRKTFEKILLKFKRT